MKRSGFKIVLLIIGVMLIVFGVLELSESLVAGLVMIAFGVAFIICWILNLKKKEKPESPSEERAPVPAPPESLVSPAPDGNSVVVNKIASPFAVSSYVVFDLETTGVDTRTCEIIEIGAYKVINGAVTEAFSSLVKPSGEIPPEATKVNHITNEMVNDAPPIESVISQFEEFIREFPLMGYNIARFDIPVLKRYLKDNRELNIIDVYSIVNTLAVPAKSKKLTDVATYFCVPVENAHRSLGDCLLTNNVFKALSKWVFSKAYRSKDDVNEIGFDGANFVVTGIFAMTTRENVEDIIINKGGSLKTGMSGKVDYLIVGSLGSSHYTTPYGEKVDKALEIQENGGKIKIVNEEVFLRIVKDSSLQMPSFSGVSVQQLPADEETESTQDSGTGAEPFVIDKSKPLTLEDKAKMLMKLQKMLGDGEITQEEFEERKNEFLFL